MTKVLITDDEAGIRKMLQIALKRQNHEVLTASSGENALHILKDNVFDVVITDLKMPGISGIELLEKIKKQSAETEVILMTAHSSIESAMEAVRSGAFDYIEKPFSMDEMELTVLRATEQAKLRKENKELKKELNSGNFLGRLVGNSEPMKEVINLIRKTAPAKASVLITGESGTGKEVLANMLHQSGSRADKPFVSINCGAIPEELLESELFGHVKGAFTGAVRARAGRFEVANGGTIFLDEIGDMSPKLQVKLLRVLQERSFEPVGSHQTIHIDVRVVAATHRDLEDEITAGRFRQDLYYRLNVIPLMLPSLKQRGDDVILLTEHFLSSFNKLKNSQITGISDQAKEVMMRYNWPGNVRELQNLVERVTTLKRSGEIDIEDLPSRMLDTAERAVQGYSIDVKQHDNIDFKGIVDEFESHLITSALERFGWNKNQAAKFLTMNRTTLVEKIKKKGLTPAE